MSRPGWPSSGAGLRMSYATACWPGAPARPPIRVRLLADEQIDGAVLCGLVRQVAGPALLCELLSGGAARAELGRELGEAVRRDGGAQALHEAAHEAQVVERRQPVPE